MLISCLRNSILIKDITARFMLCRIASLAFKSNGRCLINKLVKTKATPQFEKRKAALETFASSTSVHRKSAA